MNQDIQIAHKRNKQEAFKKIAYGVIWCLIVVWFSHGSVSNAFDELKLIRYGQTAEGVVTKCFEEIDDGEEEPL